jgi:hypothetical protein
MPKVNPTATDANGQTRSRTRAKLSMTPIPVDFLQAVLPRSAARFFDRHHIFRPIHGFVDRRDCGESPVDQPIESSLGDVLALAVDEFRAHPQGNMRKREQTRGQEPLVLTHLPAGPGPGRNCADAISPDD